MLTRFSRLAVAALGWSVAASAHAAMPTTAPATQPIRVAIYLDDGGGEVGPKNVERCVENLPAEFAAKRVNAKDIQDGALDNIDVLVQPGGSGSKQAKALGENGRENIRKFVEHGGGYIGICAGSYLASSYYPWSLNILNAKVIDREHWARGTGDVKLRLTDEGKKLFDTKEDVITVYYGQGPLLGAGDRKDVQPYEVLATYDTEIATKNDAPKGVMIGTTAIARGTFGKGRVFCLSPHPEKSADYDATIRRAIDWAAGR